MGICWNGQPTAQGDEESVVTALMSTIPIKSMMNEAQETESVISKEKQFVIFNVNKIYLCASAKPWGNNRDS